jgi:hypothetical protein
MSGRGGHLPLWRVLRAAASPQLLTRSDDFWPMCVRRSTHDRPGLDRAWSQVNLDVWRRKD